MAVMLFNTINDIISHSFTYIFKLLYCFILPNDFIIAQNHGSISAVTNRMLPNLNLRPPRMKTKFGQNNFAYRGAKMWNSLTNDCRKLIPFQLLKRS